MASIKWFLAAVVVNLVLAPCATAGPPLVIDDPGILEPGSWEFIIALSGESRTDGKSMDAPLIDVSRGLTANTQVSMSLPRVTDRPKGEATLTGLSTASVAYKWRFAASRSWEWAFAPHYTVPVSHAVIAEDSTDDVRVLGLPLLASRVAGDWTWLGQAGWNTDSDGVRYWDYGLAVSHPLGRSAQWMLGVHGGADTSFKQSSSAFRLGLDAEISPAVHLLAAAGSRLKSAPGPDARLDLDFYLGLQWFYGP